MGLLTDARRRGKFTNLLVVHHRKAIVLSFLSGVVWFALLPLEPLNNKTYFSENALLPGLVVREFNYGKIVSRVYESLKEEALDHPSLPYSWLQAQFRQLGLDVYQHNFTLHYPFGSKLDYHGNNFYAILRAPKSSSTEALVLSTPYRGFDSIHETSLPSIALMIVLAQAFRHHSYWSKDIIFLVTEHEMIGFQAWLEAYHESHSSEYLDSGSLIGRSGSIQAVINLEIKAEKISHFDIKIEGLNGQLPNLDLFNLAVELCAREMVVATFQSQLVYPEVLTLEAWKYNLLTMLSMMGTQATGLPTAGHGLFHRYGIQAITLVGSENLLDSSHVTFTQMGRVLEGIFRSLNNLLEKFHQSFFFYLLPSTRRYISIGLYIPPFALIAAPILIKALYLYVCLNNKDAKDEKSHSASIFKNVSLWSSLDMIVINHVIGSVVYFSSDLVDYIGKFIDLSLEDIFYYIHIILLCISFLFIYVYNKKKTLTHDQYNVKLCVSLLELGAFLYTLSLINISLATFLALMYVPISITLGFKNKLLIHKLFLFLINPFLITYFIIVVQSFFSDSNIVWWRHFTRSAMGHKKVILFTVEDLYLFNNWNYRAATLILLPLWLQLWTLGTKTAS